MNLSDVFLLLIRWIHLVSAATWVGGSLFYLLILKPSVSNHSETGVMANTAAEFKSLVNTCIVVLIATGLILAFNRLSEGIVNESYVIILGLKSALSVFMIILVHTQRRRTRKIRDYDQESGKILPNRFGQAISGFNSLVMIGIVIFLLSDLLKVIYEKGL